MPKANSGFLVGGVKLLPMLGDITKLKADAVVQSGGTSVDQEIHLSSWAFQAGEKELGAALSRHAPMQLGDVIVSHAGALPARYLFTAIVLDWGRQHPANRLIIDEVITSAASKCIHVATALGLKSIAFTPWGTRVTGRRASEITALMVNAIVSQILDDAGSLERVYLVSHSRKHYEWFVDRAFVFEMLLGQVSQIRQVLDELDIPSAQREHLRSLMDNVRHNVVNYIEIVRGDKTTVGDIKDSEGIAVGTEAKAKMGAGEGSGGA
jgi:O-acetyl-ADP-ribose deacetylase (regulator of RNase III)